MQAPGSVHKLNYLQHREEKVAADLALIAGLLSNSRENGTIGDMGASYNTQVSMKMASKTMSAKMSTTSMMRRTARSKCKWLSLLQLAAVSSCVSVVCLLACLFLPVCLAFIRPSLSVYLSVCLAFICLSVCLSVRQSVSLLLSLAMVLYFLTHHVTVLCLAEPRR